MKKQLHKKITPMSRISHNLQQFKAALPLFGIVTLNQRQESGYHYMRPQKLAVNVDSIIIFNEKNFDDKNKAKRSFAFNFNYLKVDGDEQTIRVSIKPDSITPDFSDSFRRDRDKEVQLALNEKIQYSASFSVPDFNKKLKELTNTLKKLNESSYLNSSMVIEIVKETFSISSDSLGKEVESVLDAVESSFQSISHEISDVKDAILKSNLELDAANQRVQEQLHQTDAYIKREALLKKIKALNSAIKRNESELVEKESVTEITSEIESNQTKLNNLMRKKQDNLTNFSNKHDPYLRKKIHERVKCLI